MKLLSFSNKKDNRQRAGIFLHDRVIDLEKAAVWAKVQNNYSADLTPPVTVNALLKEWSSSFPKLTGLLEILLNVNPADLNVDGQSAVVQSSDVIFHPPVSNPPSFRDFYAFEQHVKTARALRKLRMIPEWYEFPVFYFSNPNAFLGHGQSLRKPEYTRELDYELEIACIIGRQGRDIQPENAADYIAGYSILNDWSARDIQRQEMRVGLGPAKGKDFASSLGPYLVTPDEIEGLRKNKGYLLKMTAKRNGRLLSEGNFADITYSFEEMIARASQGVTLFPGDVIGSGTVGTGCILELRPEQAGGWIEKGDLVELEIDRLGILSTLVD
ncbi:MAG: fumarylacetoacetate hydrolase family protein [Calditrichaceae bacterium]